MTIFAITASYGIAAAGSVEAPGVYVGGAKIASIGLRVRHGRTYHGLSFNADMDLEPFSRINPCGYQGLAVTDARRLGITASLTDLQQQLAEEIGVRWEAVLAAGPLTAGPAATAGTTATALRP